MYDITLWMTYFKHYITVKKISQEGMKRANSYLKHGFAIYTAIFFNYRNDIRINREKLK